MKIIADESPSLYDPGDVALTILVIRVTELDALMRRRAGHSGRSAVGAAFAHRPPDMIKYLHSQGPVAQRQSS